MANTMQSDVKQTGSGAAEVASTAKDRAVEVSGAAGAEAKAVAQDAAAHARKLVDDTRGQLRTQASEQTDRLTGTLRDVADQLRSMAKGKAHAGCRGRRHQPAGIHGATRGVPVGRRRARRDGGGRQALRPQPAGRLHRRRGRRRVRRRPADQGRRHPRADRCREAVSRTHRVAVRTAPRSTGRVTAPSAAGAPC